MAIRLNTSNQIHFEKLNIYFIKKSSFGFLINKIPSKKNKRALSVQNEELTLRCLAHISFSFFTIRVRARTILILEETEKCTLNFKSYSSYKIIFLSTISFEIPSRADFHCLQGSLLIFFSHLYICRGHTGSFSGTGTKADLDNHSNQMNPNNSRFQPKQ